MKKQSSSMTNVVFDNEYGLYFPSGIDEYRLNRIVCYIGIRKIEGIPWQLWLNGTRVRTNRESGSHPCYNCGHCIDNGFASCHRKNCIRDRKNRGLCEEQYHRSKKWIHEFEYTYDTVRKGVVYIHGTCSKCHKEFKWLGDYPQDYHIVLYSMRAKLSAHKTRNMHARTALGELRHLCLKRDNFKCRDCGIHKNESPLEIDHIVPFSKGGLTHLDNLQTLCKKCNRSKHTRTWRGGV